MQNESKALNDWEIDWHNEADRTSLSERLGRHGATLIRHFFPDHLVLELDDIVRSRFERASPDDVTPINPEDMWARVLEDEFYLKIFRYCRETGLTGQMEKFLDDDVISVIEATVSIRQVKPKGVNSEFFGWHQDTASFHWRPRHRFVSCWCPLTEAGETAPGLSVIMRRLPGLAGPRDSSRSVTSDELDAIAPDWQKNVVTPNFRAGDILVFDNFSVHGTYLAPSQSKTRRDVDFRFLQKSNMPTVSAGLRYIEGEFDSIKRTGPEFEVDILKRVEMQAETIRSLINQLEDAPVGIFRRVFRSLLGTAKRQPQRPV